MWWIDGLCVVWTILSLAGLLPNMLVIYCVIMRTPKDFRAYSILLLNLALTETLSTISSWLIMERAIPSPDGFKFIAYGVCGIAGPRFCFVAHTIMLHTYGNLVIIIPLSFGFRNYILNNQTPRPRTIVIISLIFYIPSIFAVIALNQIYAGPEIVLPQLDTVKYVDIFESMVPAYGLTDIHSWQNIYLMLYIMASWVPSYIIALILRRRIIKQLPDLKHLSENTRRMHKTLVKALSLQACVPVIGIIAVGTFCLGSFGLVQHPLIETSTFLIATFVPILNGSINLYYVPYYRSIVASWLGKGPSRASTIAPAATLSRDNLLTLT